MKNDEDVGRGTSYPDHASTGSINAIVNLKKGDVVLLRHWEGIVAETIKAYPFFILFMGVAVVVIDICNQLKPADG
jgi:hypothetical protein